MKTMKSLKGKIVRVSDERASDLYHEGYQYLPKSEWKETINGADKEVHGNPLGVGFAHKDTKSNKMSKSQKRHIRKTL
tara:strand:+ start:578 stop:811 length:234 start_codon:yes stop_codon:yes gene_type:complete